MEEKEILLKVPQGKKAEWNEEGYIQLVDEEPEQPKDITERVKTLYDAQKVLEERADLGDTKAKQLLTEYNAINTSETSIDMVAYLQLRIITAALNEGWEPKFTEDETRWYPYLALWTDEEIKDKSPEWKDDHQLLLWGGSAHIGTRCGSSFSFSYGGWAYAYAYIGSRLAYKTQALAVYAGRQFASVFARFYIGEQAKDAKPWREFEKEQQSK